MISESKQPVFVHEKGLCESDSVGAGTRVWPSHTSCPARASAKIATFATTPLWNPERYWEPRYGEKSSSDLGQSEVEDEVSWGRNGFTNDFTPRVGFSDPLQFRKTLVKRGASIGAQATIVCGVTLGERCFVGAGSS